MSAKEIMFSERARHRLAEGLNVLANTVKVTLGRAAPTSSSRSRGAGPRGGASARGPLEAARRDGGGVS